MRVLITGGNSNLGKAVCGVFSSNGWECIVTSRSGEGGVCLDYEKPFDKESFLSEVGEVDCLVNNAGVFTEGKQLSLPEESFDKVFQVNMKGLFQVTQALLPSLMKRDGSIVNVCSINAIHPGFGSTAHYDATKGAVKAYTASLAMETGLRVNAVAPGLLSAGRLKGSALENYWCGHSVRAEMVEPMDVANAIYFLATSKGIYGQCIVVDNGYLLR